MAERYGKIDNEKLQNVLLAGAYLEATDIEAAQKLSTTSAISFAEALLSLGLLTKEILGQSIAESLGYSFIDRDGLPSERERVLKIPEETAKKNRIVCSNFTSKTILIASDEPSAILKKEVKELFPGLKVELRYALPEDIEAVFKLYEKPLSEQFTQLFADSSTIAIPELVQKVLDNAIDLKVSDVHFEPRKKDVAVRFRIDGTLLEIARIPKSLFENVLNRIKVLARLPFDEHQRTLDGSFQHEKTDAVSNVRVSIAPTIDGEKVVLRLLSGDMKQFSFDTLGFSAVDQEIFNQAARKPFGMILVTGPTGSGKTTSLYAFLTLLNTNKVNITTIEDPIEYKVEGVNQMQTNSATGLTFASGLRTIVRQDPDIVLVGEIRDKETAEISVNAALTGRLLFSTFHSNDASTAIPRLLDMGIEPFLLSSTLELVVAQRLVRKICDSCKETYSLARTTIARTSPKVLPYFGDEKHLTLYRGKGCSSCHMTGYRGRTGIFELITISPEMQQLISTRPSRAAIWEVAKKNGSIGMFADGFEKVKLGVTTIEELLRVAEPE